VERGFIVHPTYRIRSGVPVIQIFGRLESGPAFWVEDDRERPFFYVPEGHETPLCTDPAARLAECEQRDLRGRSLLRVETDVPALVPRLRAKVERAGGCTLEADIRFAYRYLIDRGIRGGIEIDGEAEEARPGLLRFRNPELRPAESRPTLRTLSLDLETTPDAGRILSAALVSDGGPTGPTSEEVHLVYASQVLGAVVHPDEASLLRALVTRFRELDPDVILGWNVVDFDFRVLLARCQALDVACPFGRSRDEPRLLEERGPRRRTRALLPGRMVLDGIPLVRDALRLPDYRLETVAQELLGRGKKIDQEAPDAAAEILRMYHEEPEALVAYNLEDARLVPEILAKEGLFELTVERSRLSGMQLDRVGASIASFDLLYLPELHRRGVVAPSVDAERKTEGVQGGAVLEPQPGLHRDIAVLDFKSLYPSLIRTFHLDPLAHACGGEGDIEAPGGARFSRREAILPGILERLMERRTAAKALGDRHADQALKIMMNATFGVLGASACRFFDAEIAGAITGFGQQTLHWTREAFEALGVHVLYGDTDSVFVALPETRSAAARLALARSLRDRVQAEIEARIRREYAVEPTLDLELERIFDRLLLPRVRGGRSGSKKRYAGWCDDRLVVVGLESVRRDWPRIAHRLQEGMLVRLFSDRPVAPFVSQIVEQLRAGNLDDELVYSKRIRKGSLDRYTTNAPHIQAARKAGRHAGRIIHYVLTATGPEPVLPGRPLPDAIDHVHYVEKVIRPVAVSILDELGLSFEEALGEPHQLSLL